MAYLQVKDFSKRFNDTKVLKGVSLSIEKGEVLSIIGSSGGGKTTLLRCINFLTFPDTGEMILEGTKIFDANDVKNYKTADLRKKRLNFGLVFQSFNLFPQYTVKGNVMLAPNLLFEQEVSDYKRTKPTKDALKKFIENGKNEISERCHSILKKVGLLEKLNNYPNELSGGQQQRVAIARAMALKPKILCFDEPTSALDPELTGEVLKVIKELKEDSEITMIIVTHEMAFAREISDKVIYIADGVIAEQGTPEQLFDNPKTEKLQQFLSRSLK